MRHRAAGPERVRRAGEFQGYNTRRPFEIAFLIELAIAWKKLPQDRQAEVAADPWLFQEVVDSIEDAESKQLRHMLLHLLFPEYFERIASGNHKRRVIKAFSGLVTAEAEDDDRAILAIRKELEKLLPNQELDFYWSPLVEAWYDDSEGASEGAPLEIIQHKKQIVLYGPPGTGKTFRAKKLAERVIRSAALSQMGPARYFQSQPAIESAIRDNVHRLQLHPAYSYEDFIRALHISNSGGTEYRAGYLPKLIEDIEQLPRAERLPHILILDEMNRTDLSRMLGECFSLLEDRNQTIELPARNGDGASMKLRIPDDLYVIGTMNLIDQSIEQIDFALRRRFLWLICPFDAEALVGAAESKWQVLKSGLEWDRIEPDFRKLAAAAAALNRQIHDSPLLGSQYEIGHTYLLDVVVFLRNFLGARPTRKQNYLWNKKGEALEPVVQVQALACRAMLEGGECLVRLRYRRPEDGLPVGLQLQLLEPEHLPATLNQELPSGNVIRAGIEFDRLGRRAAYHLYRSHPGDGSLAPMSGTGALEGALALPQFNQNKRDYLSARWIPQGWQWVDPKKEFDAMLTAIRAGLLSRSEAISAFGYDAEDIDREIAADNQRADELGLVFDSDPRHDRPVPVVDSRPPDELDDPDITNA